MPGLKPKTPSTRLRAVIYLYWEQNLKDKYIKFDDYYKMVIESFIVRIKKRLK